MGHKAIMFNRIDGIRDGVFGKGLRFRIPFLQSSIMYNIRSCRRKILSPVGSKNLEMVNISLRVLSRPDAVESPTMYPICKEVSKSAVDEFNTSPFIPQRQQVALVSQVFERVDGRIAVLPPRFSSYFFSRRCFSSNPADDPKKPNEPNVPNRKKEDYEKMLEKLELQYGPTPDPDVVLRQLAIFAVDLNDVRDECIAAQKDLVQYRRCLSVYKFRPRIDVAEVKYLKGANLSDGKLRKILTVDESKVNAVSAKIIEAYNSASRDHQEITLNLEDIETKIELNEADIRSLSLRKATRHYLRWKYIFRFSSYKEIKGLRQVLSEEEIDELCSDISILWILAGPVHHIPLPGLTIKKEDALFGFEVLEFKSEYSEVCATVK